MKNTAKKLLSNIILGIVVGQFIGFWMATIFSAINHTSQWLPSTPDFVENFSSPLLATVVSALIWSVMGLVFTIPTTFIFSDEQTGSWQQTGIYYVVTLVLFTPLACASGWFPLSWEVILGFILIFTVIFLIIGTGFWFAARKRVNELNAELNKKEL
jgi:predicted lysophospholipase L1 biosynthesis ABC-type transport system permease subunit